MDILEKIISHKQKEVSERKELYPVKLLEKAIYFEGTPVSLKKYIQRPDKSGVIAEIKRKSPSKGMINPHVSVEKTSIGYMQAGASGLSILTDSEFFGGSSKDLETARAFNFCPILRKDFIIDEYQIVEAKAIGADVILLIAAALDPQKLSQLAAFANSLRLEVLVEVHNKEELDSSIVENVQLMGVNNRNLKTFQTDISTSKELVEHIPSEYVKVTESGLSSPDVVNELKNVGYEGFLIGEHFMSQARPEKAAETFIKQIS